LISLDLLLLVSIIGRSFWFWLEGRILESVFGKDLVFDFVSRRNILGRVCDFWGVCLFFVARLNH